MFYQVVEKRNQTQIFDSKDWRKNNAVPEQDKPVEECQWLIVMWIDWLFSREVCSYHIDHDIEDFILNNPKKIQSFVEKKD